MNLGYIYEYGRTGAPDHQKAYQFYSLAAALKPDCEAVYKLGDMFVLRNSTLSIFCPETCRRLWWVRASCHLSRHYTGDKELAAEAGAPACQMDGGRMEDQVATRVAIMGIIVEDTTSVEQLNELLHESGQYIIGRMGIPYRARGVNVISVVLDAPQDEISALAGKVGALVGVSVKTLFSNVTSE